MSTYRKTTRPAAKSRIRLKAERALAKYYSTRRDWRRLTCCLPGGRIVLVGDLCRRVSG